MAVTAWEIIEIPTSAMEADKDSVTVRCRAHTDDKWDGPLGVHASALCPQYGDVLDINGTTFPNYRCTRVRPTKIPRTNERWFDVDVEYETKFSQFKLDSKEISPIDRRAKVKYSTEELQIPMLTDAITGNLIVDTAGGPITGLTRRVLCDVWTIDLNAGSYPVALTARKGMVNSDRTVIYGHVYAAKKLWFRSLTIGEVTTENNQSFVPVTAVFVGSPLEWGHQQHILNAGLEERVSGGGGIITRRCQLNGKDADNPVPLDVQGKMIAPATLRADPLNAPHYLDRNEFVATAFGALNLPASPPL